MMETHTLTLHDQRVLAFSEFGDMAGYPVFYAHGIPGSRLEGMLYHETALIEGIRLIAVDRPGVGQSGLQLHRNLLSCPVDIRALANHLEIEKFGVMGWSSGGAPALTCGFLIPSRVQIAVSLAGYTNFGEFSQARRLLEALPLPGSTFTNKGRFALYGTTLIIELIEKHTPKLYFDHLLKICCKPDRQILEIPGIRETFMKVQDEAFRQGIEGLTDGLDIQYYDWGFSLKDIRVPVLIYQGKKDTFVPYQFAEHLHSIIPESDLTILEDQGHMFALSPVLQKRIFKKILSRVSQPQPVLTKSGSENCYSP